MAKNPGILKITKQSAVIILAAGQGKRMRSQLPKVLHEIGGAPLIDHILAKILEVSPDSPIAVIVGHGRERVEQKVRQNKRFSALKIDFVHQAEQRGTGHAVRCATESAWGRAQLEANVPILVLPGDLPLIPAALVAEMLQPLSRSDAMRLLTCHLPDPKGYGRIVRRGRSGPVQAIVEEKDADSKQRDIKEVAASIYLFQAEFLKTGIGKLSDKNAQKEYYLTDLVSQAARSSRALKSKGKIDVLSWPEPQDLRGVNDPWELAQAGKILNERIIRGWAIQGARFLDPSNTYVESTVTLAQEVCVYPGAVLRGETQVGEGATIGAGAQLLNTTVGKNANIKAGTVAENAQVGEGAQVGPYAHLRPETVVGNGTKIGNFVELKKAQIGEKTSIAHLSYIGDAEVGNRVNIGCGFVTCNYDGFSKHRTIIEDDVFLGSDCQAVAPVRIGKGAHVASGSTLTEDVPPESLAIARSRQINKPGYAKKYKKKGQS